jgi:hypothetical protein
VQVADVVEVLVTCPKNQNTRAYYTEVEKPGVISALFLLKSRGCSTNTAPREVDDDGRILRGKVRSFQTKNRGEIMPLMGPIVIKSCEISMQIIPRGNDPPGFCNFHVEIIESPHTFGKVFASFMAYARPCADSRAGMMPSIPFFALN